MTLDGEYRAVLDRIEDGVGVLLIEADGDVIDERHVDPDALPAAATEGAIFEATLDDGALEGLEHRPQETERRREELQSRVDDLAQRPPGSESDEDGADDADEETQ